MASLTIAKHSLIAWRDFIAIVSSMGRATAAAVQLLWACFPHIALASSLHAGLRGRQPLPRQSRKSHGTFLDARQSLRVQLESVASNSNGSPMR
jgi:hypothetical protein